MRDPTLEELLKLATIDPMNGKAIEAYQQMRAFQSGMEAIQHMAGHTIEHTHALTCTSCGNSVPLTEQEAQIWSEGAQEVGATATCNLCSGEVKLSAKSRWPGDNAL